MRHTYGLTEKQFSMYVKRATATHESGDGSVTPTIKLARELESRLDNVVYRAGFVTSRALARQIVSHGHIVVNGRKLTIASHQVKLGDVIAVREGSKVAKLFTNLEEKLTALAPSHVMSVNPKAFSFEIKGSVREVEPMFDTQKVLEYYSR
jgi:small subunit ribosomal protein S4